MPKVTQITTCRLCGCNDLKQVLALHPTPIGDRYLPPEKLPSALQSYPLDLFQCSICGHVQLGALVDPSDIYSNYLYTTSVSLGLKEHFQEYADTVCTKLSLKKGSFIVDIGSNDGTLLRVFKERGMKVLGIDPAQAIAERASSSGIKTLTGFFDCSVADQIRKTYGAADLVIANNVVANVPDPTDFVRGVYTLLADQGNFVWETGYVRYLTEDCVFDNIHHEHIDYYAIKPLVPFYEKFGLVLYDVEVSSSKGSSIRSYVTKKAADPEVTPQVTDLISREQQCGYFTAAPYKRLSEKLDRIREDLHQLLGQWRQEGKVVAGYGASIGVTTILYHFELGPYLNFLVDDNPIRVGLSSPGLGIPVEASARLSGIGKPDYVVILAWRYIKAIIERNQSYLENGGSFLKILPEIERLTRKNVSAPT